MKYFREELAEPAGFPISHKGIKSLPQTKIF